MIIFSRDVTFFENSPYYQKPSLKVKNLSEDNSFGQYLALSMSFHEFTNPNSESDQNSEPYLNHELTIPSCYSLPSLKGNLNIDMEKSKNKGITIYS